MPIDQAMSYELAEIWMSQYLGAQRMTPSHPFREAAFAAADLDVMNSYRNVDTSDWDDGPFTAEVVCEQIGQDVATLLRGIAEYIVANHANRTQEGTP